MNTMSRYVWLDYVKSIAIVLVVLFHSGAVTCKATAPLLAMGVPLFFVANGALVLNKEHDIQYFLIKLLKILFLILFWGTISSLNTMHSLGEGISAVKAVMYALHLHFGYAHIFWFLATLFTLYCFYPIIQYYVTHGLFIGLVQSAIPFSGSFFSEIVALFGGFICSLLFSLVMMRYRLTRFFVTL